MSEERRSKVLKSAMELFLHYGFRRATMGDIARESGISRPTLYAMYKNKEAVFGGVAEHYVKGMQSKLDEHFNPESSLTEKLDLVLKMAIIEPFKMFENSRMKWELLSIEDPQVQESIEMLNDAHEQFFARCFEGHDDIQKRLKRDPSQLGRMMSSACHGLKQNARDLGDLESMLGTLMGLLA